MNRISVQGIRKESTQTRFETLEKAAKRCAIRVWQNKKRETTATFTHI